jgi:ubiquinone/menaquinone biosynthesis C-methylase UbiE
LTKVKPFIFFVGQVMKSLLRLLFRWLYHPFAFSYDLVATAVSFGHWNEWAGAVLPFVEGEYVLELGHGPGHLQGPLRARTGWTAGLDESKQMSRIAARRIRKSGLSHINLVRGLAQSLPFRDSTFDTLVSTFPSEYIFDARTLAEVRRVLRPSGRLVTIPVAWPSNRLLSWLFRFTGEAPSATMKLVEQRLSKPFTDQGFQVELHQPIIKSGRLMIIIASPGEE